MRRVFQTNVPKFIFWFHLHNISYILYISYINFVYITCIICISYIFTISFTPLTSPTSSTWASSTSHASSTSTSAYLLPNSHGVMYKGLVTQEFLHRNCYKGILAHELLHWSWYTGVNFQVIYLYLNSYKTPTSQVLLNSLLRRQGQPKPVCETWPSAEMVRVGRTMLLAPTSSAWIAGFEMVWMPLAVLHWIQGQGPNHFIVAACGCGGIGVSHVEANCRHCMALICECFWC